MTRRQQMLAAVDVPAGAVDRERLQISEVAFGRDSQSQLARIADVIVSTPEKRQLRIELRYWQPI